MLGEGGTVDNKEKDLEEAPYTEYIKGSKFV